MKSLKQLILTSLLLISFGGTVVAQSSTATPIGVGAEISALQSQIGSIIKARGEDQAQIQKVLTGIQSQLATLIAKQPENSPEEKAKKTMEILDNTCSPFGLKVDTIVVDVKTGLATTITCKGVLPVAKTTK